MLLFLIFLLNQLILNVEMIQNKVIEHKKNGKGIPKQHKLKGEHILILFVGTHVCIDSLQDFRWIQWCVYVCV